MANTLPSVIATALKNISSTSEESYEAVKREWLNKTKPPESLGVLENIVCKLGAIQRSSEINIDPAHLIVFAGSHGITEEGVSAFPPEVNSQMFANFNTGGAAINVLCKHHGIHFKAIDAGIDKPTSNFAKKPAMTETELSKALLLGWNAVPQNAQLIAFGEMGIGNTTSATTIAALLCDCTPDQITGHGTGINEDQRNHKINVIQNAINLHKEYIKSPLDLLQHVGGKELAAITGAMIRCASEGIGIFIDGVICTAAAAIAFELNPKIVEYTFASHLSVEAAHKKLLDKYTLSPLLSLDMRLGEGSGAAMGIGIAQAAIKLYQNMATFQSAGISGKSDGSVQS